MLTTDIKQEEELSTEEEDSSEMDWSNWSSYEEDSSEEEESNEEEESREMNIDERSRRKEEEKFLEFCEKGVLETVTILLTEDPSLINCEDYFGKFRIKC